MWILGLEGLNEIGPVYTNPCHKLTSNSAFFDKPKQAVWKENVEASNHLWPFPRLPSIIFCILLFLLQQLKY